jgi:hypothetical protein
VCESKSLEEHDFRNRVRSCRIEKQEDAAGVKEEEEEEEAEEAEELC